MKRLMTYKKKDRTVYLLLTIGFGVYALYNLKQYYFHFSYYISDHWRSFLLFFLFLYLYLDSKAYLKENKIISSDNNSESHGTISQKASTIKAIIKENKPEIYCFSICYIAFLCMDFWYLIYWFNNEKKSILIFLILLLVHLAITIAAIRFYICRKVQKKMIRVDGSHVDTIGVLVFCFFAFFFSMVSYIVSDQATAINHSERFYITSNFSWYSGMTISSNDLQDGIWNLQLYSTNNSAGLSPHLYFDPVEGADHYVVYMVDETSGSYGTWLATEIHENELFTGDNLTIHAKDTNYRYSGLMLPTTQKDHTITVYVYALKDEPFCNFSPLFSEDSYFPCISGSELYNKYLNKTKERNLFGISLFKDTCYGNVISYGYISGTYTPQ